MNLLARQILRVAQNIMLEDEIAKESGRYEHFTGEIIYGKNYAEVEDATFTLGEGKIYWEDGLWKRGTWIDGFWKNGTWLEGVWHKGTWKDGIWKKGLDGEGNEYRESPNLWEHREMRNRIDKVKRMVGELGRINGIEEAIIDDFSGRDFHIIITLKVNEVKTDSKKREVYKLAVPNLKSIGQKISRILAKNKATIISGKMPKPLDNPFLHIQGEGFYNNKFIDIDVNVI